MKNTLTAILMLEALFLVILICGTFFNLRLYDTKKIDSKALAGRFCGINEKIWPFYRLNMFMIVVSVTSVVFGGINYYFLFLGFLLLMVAMLTTISIFAKMLPKDIDPNHYGFIVWTRVKKKQK